MTATFKNVQLTTQWKDGVFQIVEDADYNGPHHTQPVFDEVSEFTVKVTADLNNRWGRYQTEAGREEA
jgi:hypothetical protein